jgi:hypothetical protein
MFSTNLIKISKVAKWGISVWNNSTDKRKQQKEQKVDNCPIDGHTNIFDVNI